MSSPRQISMDAYLAYIREVAAEWPSLQILVDFLNRDVRFGQQKATRQWENVVQSRMSKVNVQVVDIHHSPQDTKILGSSSTTLTPVRDLTGDTPEERLACLEAIIGEDGDHELSPARTEAIAAGAAKPPTASQHHRLILVEDLSRDMIAFLGSVFDLDPLFFEGHLQGIEEFGGEGKLAWNGTRRSAIPGFGLFRTTQSFLSMRYSNPYKFTSWAEVNESRLRANVPRMLFHAGTDVYSYETISLCPVIKDRRGRSYSILIFDKPLTALMPTDVSVPNICTIPAYSDWKGATGPLGSSDHKLSPKQSFIYNLRRHLASNGSENVPNLIVYVTLAFGLSLHATLIQGIRSRPLRHVKNFNTPESLHLGVRRLGVENLMHMLHRTRRCVLHFQKCLDVIRHIFLSRLDDTTLRTGLVNIVVNLTEQYDQLKDDLDSQIQFVTQAKSAIEAESMSRLTKLAFFFIPLSSVAAVLSISSSQRYWLFGSLVVPMLIILFFTGIKGLGASDLVSAAVSYFRSLPQLSFGKRVNR